MATFLQLYTIFWHVTIMGLKIYKNTVSSQSSNSLYWNKIGLLMHYRKIANFIVYNFRDPLRGVFFIVLARGGSSRYARIVPTINANHSSGELYHFLTKVQHTQSSCKWEQVRAHMDILLGPGRIYTHFATHLGTPPCSQSLCNQRKKDR